MLNKLITWIVAIAVAWAAVCSPLPAQANPVNTDNVQVQLVSEVKAIKPGAPFWVALRFKIRPGWHTYWQNPGDSGAIATINWTLPKGLKAGEIVWPHPERFPVGPLVNFGYKDEVYLLTEIKPDATEEPTKNSVTLKAKADWLVCEKECIPENATLNLTLPAIAADPPVDERWATAFDNTRQAVPKPSPWKVAVNAIDENALTLRVDAPMQADRIKEVAFFPYKDGVIANAAAQKFDFKDNGLTLRLQRGYQTALDKVDGVLVIREQLDSKTVAQAFDIQAVATAAAPTSKTAAAPDTPVWQALLLALLGGVTLNLMPCVFPVLSLKALSIAQKAQHSSRQVRMQGLAFTGGVLASFAIMASVLIGLRAIGQQIGWGFQLQSPVFVALMAYVLFAVGLSLSGVFIVGSAIVGLGQGLTMRSGYAGEFFTGVFATVVATPCTAPFMATAIGVALAQSPAIALAILETLGFGLALPYLVLSFTPGLRRILPKPGAWMETFQQLLAFPMYAAAAWLVWVLAQQTGTDGLAAALFGIVLIGFAAWLYQKARTFRNFWRRVGWFCALAALGGAIALASLAGGTSTSTVRVESSGLAWKPYTAQLLAEERRSGKPVFVNFSASWCITCLVNDRVALSQPEVIAAFQKKGAALLKGDWTNRNPAITEALRLFGRSGVPLYVLYPAGPNKAAPQVLPQVLTPAVVQNALDKVDLLQKSPRTVRSARSLM